jgi:hypothetical protein
MKKTKKYIQPLGLFYKADKSDATMLAKYGAIQLNNIALWIPEKMTFVLLKR